MDIYTVIGIRNIDFVAEDGTNIKGITIYSVGYSENIVLHFRNGAEPFEFGEI